MTLTTFQPSTIFIEVDVSGLSLIDAERYFNALKSNFPCPRGCKARAMLDYMEVE